MKAGPVPVPGASEDIWDSRSAMRGCRGEDRTYFATSGSLRRSVCVGLQDVEVSRYVAGVRCRGVDVEDVQVAVGM